MIERWRKSSVDPIRQAGAWRAYQDGGIAALAAPTDPTGRGPDGPPVWERLPEPYLAAAFTLDVDIVHCDCGRTADVRDVVVEGIATWGYGWLVAADCLACAMKGHVVVPGDAELAAVLAVLTTCSVTRGEHSTVTASNDAQPVRVIEVFAERRHRAGADHVRPGRW